MPTTKVEVPDGRVIPVELSDFARAALDDDWISYKVLQALTKAESMPEWAPGKNLEMDILNRNKSAYLLLALDYTLSEGIVAVIGQPEELGTHLEA